MKKIKLIFIMIFAIENFYGTILHGMVDSAREAIRATHFYYFTPEIKNNVGEDILNDLRVQEYLQNVTFNDMLVTQEMFDLLLKCPNLNRLDFQGKSVARFKAYGPNFLASYKRRNPRSDIKVFLDGREFISSPSSRSSSSSPASFSGGSSSSTGSSSSSTGGMPVDSSRRPLPFILTEQEDAEILAEIAARKAAQEEIEKIRIEQERREKHEAYQRSIRRVVGHIDRILAQGINDSNIDALEKIIEDNEGFFEHSIMRAIQRARHAIDLYRKGLEKIRRRQIEEDEAFAKRLAAEEEAAKRRREEEDEELIRRLQAEW